MKHNLQDYLRLINWWYIIPAFFIGPTVTIGSYTINTAFLFPVVILVYEFLRVRSIFKRLPENMNVDDVKSYMKEDFSRHWASPKDIVRGLRDKNK